MAHTTLEIQTGGKTVDKAGVFHIIKELIGFVLFMHQQIPNTLQLLELEFTNLKLEQERIMNESTETETQFKSTSQRKMIGKLRETKRKIRKLEKLINTTHNLLSAVQTMIYQVSEIQLVLLAIGASPTRPQHVYEIHFACKESVPQMVLSSSSAGKKARADVVSKKIIRELISVGAGCAGTYSGPTKLFLLIKAPATTNLPEAFLPKRDYSYSRKVNPFRVHVTSGHGNGGDKNSNRSCQTVHVTSSYGNEEDKMSNQPCQTNMFSDTDHQNVNFNSNDIIWFQCRYTVKGCPCQGEQYRSC